MVVVFCYFFIIWFLLLVCVVPRSDHVDVRCSDIVLQNRVIAISPEAVHHVLGIPIGGRVVKSEVDSDKALFLELFG